MNPTSTKSIVRCDRAGVFYATVESLEGSTAVLRDVRRIHYWQGAASLSQLAMEGCGSGSRITMTVPSMTVLGVIEVIPCTDAAVQNLDRHPAWKV